MSNGFTFVPATKPKRGGDIGFRLKARRRLTANGCMEWTGPRLPAGYGRMHVGGRVMLTHRLAYEVYNGPIPDGYEIDHLCRNTCCINPDHLEAVTQEENRRRQGSAVTRCPRGHAYTPENTYTAPSSPRERRCRTCARERQRKAGR